MQIQKIQIRKATLGIYYEPVVAPYAYGQILHYCEDTNNKCKIVVYTNTNTNTQTQTQTQTHTNTNTNTNENTK